MKLFVITVRTLTIVSQREKIGLLDSALPWMTLLDFISFNQVKFFSRNVTHRSCCWIQLMKWIQLKHCHYVKSVRIRSFTGPYFPAFKLNTERYSVSVRIQSKCGRIRTRKTPNTNTLHAVSSMSQFTMLKRRARTKKFLLNI